jgi:hypothetical protein
LGTGMGLRSSSWDVTCSGYRYPRCVGQFHASCVVDHPENVDIFTDI